MKEEDIKRLNAKIIEMVLAIDLVESECDLFRLEDHFGTTYRQAVAKVDDEISVVFSLPQGKTSNIYILASDGQTDLLRNILANIEESEKETNIALGNLLLLNSEELIKRDICGVIFLPVDISNVLDSLPNNFCFENNEYKFLLVTFITNEEHQVWKNKGHDALMDYFTDNDKDLLLF
ncbi:hypothetical protein SG34_000725 [Thalassomonas viridans]|uniref:Suppressor of fused-like domain-containing protein n=1 Tax=Thalassomonas viridans TaxID=137584 RepID=A0AAE9Z5H7_9GAMM|nr:hypothetical protein [Thalassomonas viridans]WDE05507.1 hypothetical protein SG34_000725 [Thalassomonas viridans]